MKTSIIIMGRNTSEWVGRCLKSAIAQRPDEILWIDDASTDDSFENACRVVNDTMGRSPVIRAYNNIERQGGLANTRTLVEAAQGEVICVLAGDDWLPHSGCLDRVKQEYEKGAWCTYGQYKTTHSMLGHCKEYQDLYARYRDVTPRQLAFFASHWITFKKDLFLKIKDEDFRRPDGSHLLCGDMAIMLPMLEMCGDRAHFIPDVIYTYNRHNQCDDIVAGDLQKQDDALIRAKKPYERLHDPVARYRFRAE